ncbi:MAG: flagellar export protein FliJ [Woeseia sp.]|nr:flagellar export protein FliJ [Woeseia sp.]MBT8097948.1 flagellar export protein FliJ [Woeseia sp.]NNE60032.1 flagellar export protein FliJ [Woeseia sp.]NNL54064.1 flagellar export protein FliJ [Woeseia sp.]
MAKKSDRLKRVQSIAESEEQTYCRAMGEAQRALNEHQRQLEELKSYRKDYALKRNPGKAGTTISSAQYSDYQSFLQRLDDAVHAQSETVRTTAENRDAHRARWMVKRQKMESLKRVVDRYQLDETQELERLEQKLQDELPSADDPFRHSS